MTIITDSSFIYALYNTKDTRHHRAMDFASQYTGETIIPEVVLPEVSYLFRRDLGYAGLVKFAERLQVTQIATFDRRDFSIFRPRHCAYLTLLPIAQVE